MFAAGDAEASIAAADLILDFEAGADRIGLAGGLTLAELTLDAGANLVGGAALDTVIRITATGEILAAVQDVSTLDAGDFILV